MDDQEAIRQAALDYIEGWYEGNGARMDRALYTQLAKRRVLPSGETVEVTKAWMVDATGDGRGRIEDPEKGKKEITILDVTDRMGSVKIVSEQFIDYLHVAKEDEKWVIVNVLWDAVEP